MTDLLTFERQYWQKGYSRIAGVDEAGRGPLAGPVVAAAVIIDREYAEAEAGGALAEVNDSKKLSPAGRERLFELFARCDAIETGVALADVAEIDAINILRAAELAMKRAVNNLPNPPDYAFIDGTSTGILDCASTAIVGGDARSMSVAAASIVAKVVRDRYMVELDAVYPQYGLARHKGYPSKIHIQALFEHGPSDIHRRTFRPVREADAIRRRLGTAG